jgi:hypothetical protein
VLAFAYRDDVTLRTSRDLGTTVELPDERAIQNDESVAPILRHRNVGVGVPGSNRE